MSGDHHRLEMSYLPGYRGRVEEGIERHRQLDMLLARNFQQDHTSKQLQFLSY
jgi:hypothetical protein